MIAGKDHRPLLRNVLFTGNVDAAKEGIRNNSYQGEEESLHTLDYQVASAAKQVRPAACLGLMAYSIGQIGGFGQILSMSLSAVRRHLVREQRETFTRAKHTLSKS